MIDPVDKLFADILDHRLYYYLYSIQEERVVTSVPYCINRCGNMDIFRILRDAKVIKEYLMVPHINEELDFIEAVPVELANWDLEIIIDK